MHIHFTIEDQDRIEGTEPIQVGWFLTDDKASPVHGNKLSELLTLMNKNVWPIPNVPILRLKLLYC